MDKKVKQTKNVLKVCDFNIIDFLFYSNIYNFGKFTTFILDE